MSKGWTRITAPAAALNEAGIDTDVIFPARFLLRMEKAGLGECLFADRRSGDDEAVSPFDLAPRDDASIQILIAGPQFGCGSSREHAVWSLVNFGIRAVIAPSFGEIFANNAARNGLAAIQCPEDSCAAMMDSATIGPLSIDLESQTITAPNLAPLPFILPEADRQALINGWDEIDMIAAAHAEDMVSFEKAYKARRSWTFEKEGAVSLVQTCPG
ncbi:MAG: 3-isopropylmalate dehydratase small subunit [Pseudomonadota bacterium]